MKRMVAPRLVALAATVSLGVPLIAKGPTVKLTITGQDFSRPIEVTEPEALVHVWSSDFIRLPAAEPDQSLPRYIVSFFVQFPASPVRMVYVVYYSVDPQTGKGFVYLPGRGEEWYTLNASTILRPGQDGKWHHASDRWSMAISAGLN